MERTVAATAPKGASVEVFSTSENAWLPGTVIDVNAKEQLLHLSYYNKSGIEKRQWLEMSSDHLRRCV